MAARWTAWLVWAAAAASMVFWGLRLAGQGPSVPDRARWVDTQQVAKGDVLRLFARSASSVAAEPVAALSSRFRLMGVVAAAGGSDAGWAVLSVDGKPARAVRVGGRLDGDLIVQRVARRKVEIGPVGESASVVLELSDLPAASRGVPGAAPLAPNSAVAPAAPSGGSGGVVALQPVPGAVQVAPMGSPSPGFSGGGAVPPSGAPPAAPAEGAAQP